MNPRNVKGLLEFFRRKYIKNCFVELISNYIFFRKTMLKIKINLDEVCKSPYSTYMTKKYA